MSNFNRNEQLKELHSNRKALTQEKVDKAIQRLIKTQKPINFNSVANESGLTKVTLYNNKDILIASVDGLTGFSDAIKAVFPNTEVQRCVVHQIRNTLNYVSYKHRKEFVKDLKLVHTSATEDAALSELTLLEEKWSKHYAIALRSWRNNWDELATYFK